MRKNSNLLIDGFHPRLEDAAALIAQPVVPGFVDGAGEVEQLAAIVRAAASGAKHPDRVSHVVKHQSVGHGRVTTETKASFVTDLS